MLNQAIYAYTAALETTGECLDNLQGDQLLAMEPDLRTCSDRQEAAFSSLTLEPCVDDRVEFTYDRDIANALRLGISKLGCLPSMDVDVKNVPDKKRKPPEHGSHPAKHRDVHFTLAAIVGAGPKNVAFATPSDTVIVEMRDGSEKDFLEKGIEGPVVGRVVLHTKLKGAKYLTYESEHFFESLSQRVLPEVFHQSSDDVPAVRFTKTLRVSGR